MRVHSRSCLVRMHVHTRACAQDKTLWLLGQDSLAIGVPLGDSHTQLLAIP